MVVMNRGADMSKTLNEYFISVFTHESQTLVPEVEHIFRVEKTRKLRGVTIRT